MEKIKRTNSEWKVLIEEQIGSGLTQSQFCREKSIKLATFCHYKRKLAKLFTIPKEAPSFTELPTIRNVENSWNVSPEWSFSCKIFGVEILAIRLG